MGQHVFTRFSTSGITVIEFFKETVEWMSVASDIINKSEYVK